MLKRSDLDAFVELARLAERETAPSSSSDPESLLRAAAPSDGFLHRNELTRLRCSLKIASVAGDVPDSAHRILHNIAQELSAEGFTYMPLTRSKEWLEAIAWARLHPATPASDHGPRPEQDRQWVVGRACRALRERDYRVDIDALGPGVDADTRTEIAREVDSLFAQMGGISAAEQLFRILRDTRKVHAGMWLFGNIPAPDDQPPQPAVPFGWLLSLALRNIHVVPSSANPASAWNSAARLAIDFAASTDCQRFNRFDGLFLDAPDFLPALEQSLAWRELFTLPQVPPSVLPTLRDAFSKIAWPTGTDRLRRDVDQLFVELECLLANLPEDNLTPIPRVDARFGFPLLWIHGCAPQAGVNTRYLDPFGAHPRDHDQYVFFEAGNRRVVALPPSLTAAAGCEAIFRLIWSSASSGAASDIVGDTVEKSVAIACRAHTDCVWQKVAYLAGGKNFEIDAAVRDGDEIVVFESKAKSLTSKARTGDMMAFIDDYTKSFLALVGQLVRHDQNIERGLTPLTRDDEDLDALRITKIAVSPLSYGPGSDHLLANALLNSIVHARLASVQEDPHHNRILKAFNQKLDQITRDIATAAPKEHGEIDLFGYFIDLFWLDLGQLLYSLHRGRSVPGAVSALRHLTFGTRDFWTEAAFADRQGLTEGKWLPIVEGEAVL